MSASLTPSGGRILAYEQFGDPAGRPLLYCHGVPGSRLDPALVSEQAAAAGIRVISADRPAFGRSSPLPRRSILGWTADAQALMDALGIERFGVLGYSSGCKYALACALALGPRVSAIVVAGGAGPRIHLASNSTMASRTGSR